MRGIPAFDASLQKTNLWLKDAAAEIRTDDRHKAYAGLRAVLHALRDCLPVEETAKLAAQLPLVLTGVFFDGWKPHKKPRRFSRDSFYEQVRRELRHNPGLDPALAVRAALRCLDLHLSGGEAEAVRRVLPREIRALWEELETEESSERENGGGRSAYAPGSSGLPIWP